MLDRSKNDTFIGKRNETLSAPSKMLTFTRVDAANLEEN